MRAPALFGLVAFIGQLSLAGGFRGLEWGATREDVVAAEGRPPIEETDDSLLYRDELGGLAVSVVYSVGPKGLKAGMYSFASDSNYWIHWATVESLLVEKYGEAETQFKWRDGAETGEGIAGVEKAIWRGDLTMYTIRSIGPETIRHALWGDYGDMSHNLVYEPPLAFSLPTPEDRESALEKL